MSAPVPQGPGEDAPGSLISSLLADSPWIEPRNPLDEVSCPNPSCLAGTYVPEVDTHCPACNCDVRVSVAQQLAVARQAVRDEELPAAAGITMPSLRLHQLSEEKITALCLKASRSLPSALRVQAIKLEKRARMKGFDGHADRYVLDAAYHTQMEAEGYPFDFCESVVPELVGFAVWPEGRCPQAHLPKARRLARLPHSHRKGLA